MKHLASLSILFVSLLLIRVCDGQESSEEGGVPEKYALEYPVTERFCAPVRTTFVEVEHTIAYYKGRRFRQKRNGGYGLPVVDKVGDQHLLHVGADLAWRRVGEPVFAVANGVVRMSLGPDPKPKKGADEKKKKTEGLTLAWGNLVVIEHKLPGDAGYVTTIYGHLDTERLVKTGDIVEAGQPIGTIGRKSPKINGGYDPHLHFGVREGRMVEKDVKLFDLFVNKKPMAINIIELGEEKMQINMPESAPDGLIVNLAGRSVSIEKRDGKFFIPSALMWGMQRPDFPIVGYSLTKDDWLDPVAFLREQRADQDPAPFLSPKTDRKPRK